MATLALRGVTKSFGPVPIIQGIDLDVADGRFAVLVGPSGSGKSTVLRLVAGLEEADAGEIVIGGRVVNELAPRDRDVAMVFQSYALYPHMTVRENMEFHLRLAGRDRAERERKVRAVADTLGIGHLLDRYPRALSGGQRQRVAMGRAIVRAPRVFLFDEPLSNLDAQLRTTMRAEIKALQRRLGVTTLYVTHDQAEAMTLADLMVVLNEGRIEQSGAPLEIFDRPANLFVARFVGAPAMNLLEGTVGEDGMGAYVDSAAGRLPLEAGRHRVQAGRRVFYGVRPAALAMSAEGDAILGRVELVEETGDETELHIAAGRTMLQALFFERRVARIGDAVTLRPRPGCVHLFDAETGGRLDTG